MEVVLVHWLVRPGREGDLRSYAPALAGDTPGLIAETLYQIDEPGTEDIAFVRIGYWERREDFYRELNIEPGSAPPQEDFEAAPRRREWLAPILTESIGPISI